jgi:hypothetical protein
VSCIRFSSLTVSTAGICGIHLQWLTLFPRRSRADVGTGYYTYIRAQKFPRLWSAEVQYPPFENPSAT